MTTVDTTVAALLRAAFRSRALTTGAAAFAMTLAVNGTALAQEAAPAAAGNETLKIEEVRVTGSRIQMRDGMSTPTPSHGAEHGRLACSGAHNACGWHYAAAPVHR